MHTVIGGIGVGAGFPCRVVAEVSNNHNGTEQTALDLIDAAKRAGADFIKFQAFLPDELVALRGDGSAPEPWAQQGWTMRSLYTKAQTPLAWMPVLFAYARLKGIQPFASVFGPESFDAVMRCSPVAIKVAALDREDAGLRAMVQRADVPVIVSTHEDHRDPLADITLHCPPGYPQLAENMRWELLERGLLDGFSFHGRNAAWIVTAAQRGASMVEAHLQLDHIPSELEAEVSLTENQLQMAITTMRREGR